MAKIRARFDTVGKKKLEQSFKLNPRDLFSLKKGQTLDCLKIENAQYNHCIVWVDKVTFYYFYKPHVEIFPDILLTKEKLAAIFPYTPQKRREDFLEPLNATCFEFAITTNHRLAAFFAQIGHESGSLIYDRELTDGKAYEFRSDLGNVKVGDGYFYRGAGLIQLTGRHNFTVAGRALNLPLVEYPQMAAVPQYSARIAGWYWNSRNLNVHCDGTLAGFEKITRLINGGLNGWGDRLQRWEVCKRVFI